MLKNNKKKIRRVFLIGDGCFWNGDKPLKRALKFVEDLNSNYFLPDATKLTPMHALSCLAAEERAWLIQLHQITKRSYVPPRLPNNEDPFSTLLQRLSVASSFRKIMEKSYNEDNTIAWKKICYDFLISKGLYEDDSAIITTNWDNTLSRDNNIKNVAYLHGRCIKPHLMILPTETITEFVLHNTLFTEVKETIKNLIKKDFPIEAFKLVEERFDWLKNQFDALFAVQKCANDWLKEADSLYICGLAFNIYDHELTNFISLSTLKKEWKKVCIVNRDKNKNKKCNDVAAILRLDLEKIDFFDSTESPF